MAEGLLRHAWRQSGRNDLMVTSMGVHGLDHQPAHALAREVCLENGIDISSHRSRPLIFDELRESVLILTMDKPQAQFVSLFFPALRDKISLLGAWPDRRTRKSVIKDPMGGSIKAFRKSFETIADQVQRITPILSGWRPMH